MLQDWLSADLLEPLIRSRAGPMPVREIKKFGEMGGSTPL